MKEQRTFPKVLQVVFNKIIHNYNIITQEFFVSLKKDHRGNDQRLTSRLMLAFLIGSVSLISYSVIKAANNRWIQTDWSGGIDTAAIASFPENETNWNKYNSSNVGLNTNGGAVKLSPVTNSFVMTSTSDFNAGTKSGTTVIGTGNDASITLLKPNGVACTADAECSGQKCYQNKCVSLWISGLCSNISVYYTDLASQVWQYSNTSCNAPQCSGGKLVDDNNVNFSQYPARNACKSIGGRLPTRNEWDCLSMHGSELNYGLYFQNSFYWTSEEYYDGTRAYYKYPQVNTIGTTGHTLKSFSLPIRCVR